MAEQPGHKYLRWVITLLLTAGAFAVVIFVLPWLLKMMWPLVVAWLLAVITAPVVRFLQNRLHAKQKLSSTLVLILILAAVFGAVYGVMRLLISEALSLLPDIPDYVKAASEFIDKAEAWLTGARVTLPQGLFTLIDSLQVKIGEWLISISASLGLWLTNFVASAAVNLPGYLIYTILTVLFTFYFIDGRESIRRKIKSVFPASIVSFWQQCTASFKKAVGTYLLTQMKLCVIVGATMCVCFLLKGLKYTGLLTIAITILDFLPIVGAGTILNPWGVIELLRGNVWMALYCFGLYIITQVIRNSLSPKMMGDSLSIPPLTSVLCMYVGFRFWGIWGMIIAIPLWLAFLEVYRSGALDPAIGVLREIRDATLNLIRRPIPEEAPDNGTAADGDGAERQEETAQAEATPKEDETAPEENKPAPEDGSGEEEAEPAETEPENEDTEPAEAEGAEAEK